MKIAVVDASFSASWFLKDEHSSQAEGVLELLLKKTIKLWIPSLWFYEITNLLISAHGRSRISNDLLEESLDLINALPFETDEPHPLVSRRICQLARQSNLSAYDAAYLELADRLQVPLLTFDRKLIAACKIRHLKTEL